MALPRRKSKPAPSLPSLDSDVFTTVDLTEEPEEPVKESVQSSIPKREQSIESKVASNGLSDTPFLPEEEPKEYIDRKEKKITPIGGKKAKIKDKDLDLRKNVLLGLKVARLFVFLVIIGIVALGIKNTYFPEQIYTNEEITEIARSAIGETGFPTKRGEAYGRDLLREYLDMSGSKANKQLLARVFTGKTQADGTTLEGRLNADKGMRPISEPVLFDTILATDYSAVFKYSVYMSNLDGRDVNDEGLLTGHWMSFSVNVYYDKETDSLSVLEPPTMIPTYAIRKPNRVKRAEKLGSGESATEMESVLQPTVNGFLKAFANVTVDDHEEIVQYIPNDKPVHLVSGFGGTVKLRRGEASVTKEVYKSKEPDEWKVDVRVEWQSTVVPEEQAPSFTSHYVMTIKKTNEDVYLVTKFTPYTYIEGKEE